MGRRPNGSGGISQRKDGMWEARISASNGRRVSVYGRTRAEVADKLAQLQRQNATYGGIPEPHTLGELLDRWLEIVTGELKPRTLANYRAYSKGIIDKLGGNLKLANLRPDLIQQYYASLRHVPRQAKFAHQVLHRALRLGVLWGWLSENPADRVVAPKYQPKEKEIWNAEEVQRFIGCARRWRPLWVVLASTGLRIGEARALTWPDVDLAAGTLRVSRSIQPINKKDVISTPKTRAGVRTISLPAGTVEALRDWKHQQAELLMGIGKRNEAGWLWTSDEGELIAYKGVYSAFLRDSARAGLKGTIHQLRHFHASLLLSNGLPIADTAKRLGHSKPGVTMNTYSHVLARDDRQAAEITERAFRYSSNQASPP